MAAHRSHRRLPAMRGRKNHMTAISYIWAAEQTEPGMNGVQYVATNTDTAPSALQAVPVAGAEGLVHQESLYGDWKLIGTAKGASYSNDYGSFIELDTPQMEGAPVDVADVVRCGWYSKA